VSYLNERRVLDATHLRRTLLRVFRASRRTRAKIARTSSSSQAAELEGIELKISSQHIETLAQRLQTLTGTLAHNDVDDLARVLAQIALLVNHSTPKVAAIKLDNAEFPPTAEGLSTEYALECATEYARINQYAIDSAKLPRDHIAIGLMTKDEQLLTRIFRESLGLASRIASTGRHARQTAPAAESVRRSGVVPEELQAEPTKLVLVQSQRDIDWKEPRLFERDYWNLRSTAALEGWTVHDVLTLIERRLSSALESEFTNRHRTGESERYLSARSYWNLRSIAALKAWTAHERLMLIEEHLSPTLHAEFPHHSDSESGPDWERLYYWVFPPHGRI
jgi:hypothetical protein